jgi:hypothetical protein
VTEAADRRSGVLSPGSWWPLAGGIALLALVGVVGRDAHALEVLVTPPALVRAGLVGASAVLAVACLRAALLRLQGSAVGMRHDLPMMVRGIRFVFLAIAAAAAGAAWLIGHPLPFVVAAIIAAVDVVETTFLLLVVTVRRARE